MKEFGNLTVCDFKGSTVHASTVHTYYTVGILRQSLQRQQRVVRLHNDVRNFFLVRKHGVGLDQFLWEPLTTQYSEQINKLLTYDTTPTVINSSLLGTLYILE